MSAAWNLIERAEQRPPHVIAIRDLNFLRQRFRQYALFPDATTTPTDKKMESISGARPAKGARSGVSSTRAVTAPAASAVTRAAASSRVDFGDDDAAREVYIATVRRQYNATLAEIVSARRRLEALRADEEMATGMPFGEYTSAVPSFVNVPEPIDDESLARVVDMFAGPVGGPAE